MAEWNADLPGEAVEGNPGHPEDHNKIVDALREVRSNVDEIELTPGPRGEPGTPGGKGDKGDKGDAGFGTEAQYNDIIDRLEALEAAIEA